ncbi:MAG: hypothetical protein EAX90_12300 [Candidatus Heimdallarchaeota archaeon]|nr:hypothetical protein [Candidatus Heimdallarchaeota archaeon]
MKLEKKEISKLLAFISLIGITSLLLVSLVGAQSSEINSSLIEPNIESYPPEISNVNHNPVYPDSDSTIYISATITDSDGLSTTILFYRELGDSTFNMTGLTQEGSTDVYGTPIGPYKAGLTVEYYIYAVDDSFSHYSTTDDNDGSYYSFTVLLADYEAPVISNVQQTPEVPTDNDLIVISCDVTDESDVIVLLNYRVDGSEWANQTMTNSEGNTYTTTVGEFEIGTLFEYRIYAIDQSLDNNTNLENAEGENYYFTVVINDVEGPNISDILLDPDTVLSGQTVIITCTVTDDYNGILNVTLYYRINNGDWLQASFALVEAYEVTIGPFETDDLVEFYVEAFDDSTNTNSRINNNGGSYYSFTVLENTEEASLLVLIPILSLTALGIIYRRKK